MTAGPRRSLIVDVLERDGHDLGGAIDRHMAEELQPKAGRQVVALAVAASLLENGLWAERVVELLRTPSACVDRTGDEFPERLEVLEHRRVRVIVVRGGVVHVGGDPDRIANAGMLDEDQEIGDLAFAATRGAIALRNRIAAHHAERQIGGDDFPGRLRAHELAFEPGHLRRPKDRRGRFIPAVSRAVGAHVEQEDVEQRAISDLR